VIGDANFFFAIQVGGDRWRSGLGGESGLGELPGRFASPPATIETAKTLRRALAPAFPAGEVLLFIRSRGIDRPSRKLDRRADGPGGGRRPSCGVDALP
jgi:hypothetical protein